ncbi:MAG: beta-ketoacyl-ACP synthase III [Candidatus Dormibacteria bacterium]
MSIATATQTSTGTWTGHGSRVTGLGACLPEAVFSNEAISQLTDTSDAWIRERTGIHQRAYSNGTVAELAGEAARIALERAEVPASDVDLVIVATATHELPFPSAACLVQARLGAPARIAFDVGAACSGFVYGLAIADGLLHSGAAKRALVVGAERLSRLLDPQDRSTCVLFGDGAGAVVLESARAEGAGLRSFSLGADGAQGGILYMEEPATPEFAPVAEPAPLHGRAGIRMNGQVVFRLAARHLYDSSMQALSAAGLEPADVDLLVPHQANERIMRSLGRGLEIPDERIFSNIDDCANTSAASIPLALEQAWREGRVKGGDTLLLSAFGAGLTWGSAVMEWSL